jgi:hypothetical protein
LRALIQCVAAPTFSSIFKTKEGIAVLGDAEIVTYFLTHERIVDVRNSRESADAITFGPATFEYAVGWEAGWV